MNDEKLLVEARKIQKKEGVSLTDAMVAAEARHAPKSRPYPEHYTVTIPVKQPVSRWIQGVFKSNNAANLEDRLGAYLGQHLARAMVKYRNDAADVPPITDGGAVTVRADQLKEAIG